MHSTFSPSGSNDLEGMLGTGEYLSSPARATSRSSPDMVTRFDRDATGPG